VTLLFAVTLYSSVNLSWSAMPFWMERFADNPYVTGFPGVRFYAGHPLILRNGCCVGTLCILDVRPRHFDNVGISLLRDLSQFAIAELERSKAEQ
jgi:GAF domain-containing protein